jgi:hypothetical protein
MPASNLGVSQRVSVHGHGLQRRPRSWRQFSEFIIKAGRVRIWLHSAARKQTKIDFRFTVPLWRLGSLAFQKPPSASLPLLNEITTVLGMRRARTS